MPSSPDGARIGQCPPRPSECPNARQVRRPLAPLHAAIAGNGNINYPIADALLWPLLPSPPTLLR
jgi:hypothetical protein